MKAPDGAGPSHAVGCRACCGLDRSQRACVGGPGTRCERIRLRPPPRHTGPIARSRGDLGGFGCRFGGRAWEGRPRRVPLCSKPVGRHGGRTRARTWDPLIKSQLLYQLSYAPSGTSRPLGGVAIASTPPHWKPQGVRGLGTGPQPRPANLPAGSGGSRGRNRSAPRAPSLSAPPRPRRRTRRACQPPRSG